MGLLFALAFTAAPAAKPNFIIVLADDLGGRELGSYGNAFNETPHIDKLAEEGVKFSRAYAPGPVCSPTRASLMTGQNPARHGITDFLENGEDAFLDPARVKALPRVLKAAGYRTGIIGKWHLTENYPASQGTPRQHGFDEEILVQTRYVGGGDYRFPYVHISGVTQKIFPEEELTARMNLEALEFIDRNKSEPFLLYLAHYSVHTALDAPDSVVAHFNAKRGTPGDASSATRNPVLGAMLKGIDNGVGRIAAKLKELGLDTNTLVVFTSDNGGDGLVTDNGELRSSKGNLYEGGIRIPFVARWPGGIPSGRTVSSPVILTDLFPTFATLAGASLPAGQPVDGADIGPLLKGTGDISPRSLVWHYPQLPGNGFGRKSAAAILDAQGRKLIRFYDTDSVELFDLGADGSETRDLATERPGLARQLAAELAATVDSCQWDYVFQDAFEDAEAAGWRTFGGTWTAASRAYSVNAGDGFKAMTEDRYFSNLVYQAEVTPGAAGNAGLLFRAGAAGVGRFAYRGYYAYLSAATGKVEISKTLDGVPTLLGQKPFAAEAGNPYLLRILARGDTLKVFVSDTTAPLLTVRDTTFSGGLIGVRAHNSAASFDDVYAQALRPRTVPTPVLPSPRMRNGMAPRRLRVEGTWLFPGAPADTNRNGRRYNVRGVGFLPVLGPKEQKD